MTRTITRRDFLRIIKNTILSLFALGPVSFIYGFFAEPEWIDIQEQEIILPRLPKSFSGFRILQVSDIHLGGWMDQERLSRVVRLMKQQEFDLIVMTGDYLLLRPESGGLDHLVEVFVEEMKTLLDGTVILAVLGNHDHWINAEKTREMLSHCGVIELNNDVYSLKKENEELHIAGVDDVWENRDNLDKIYQNLPETGAAILLAHEPDFADESARKGRFDLQLSGHSHGGQVVLPFFGPPILPHLGEKYPLGLYKVGGMWQYTNRGVGMIEPAVRFNCRPEITIFTLRAP